MLARTLGFALLAVSLAFPTIAQDEEDAKWDVNGQPLLPAELWEVVDSSAAVTGVLSRTVVLSLVSAAAPAAPDRSEPRAQAAAALALALAEAVRLGHDEADETVVVLMGPEPYIPSMDDVLRPAIWLGTRMAVVGFACGVVYSVGGLIVDAMTTGLNWGTALAFGALVGMPIVFGAAGFAAGGLGGAVVVGVRVLIGK